MAKMKIISYKKKKTKQEKGQANWIEIINVSLHWYNLFNEKLHTLHYYWIEKPLQTFKTINNLKFMKKIQV